MKPILGHPTIKQNLVLAYDFEESSGTTAEDSKGSNDGIISGSPTMQQTGKSGKCYDWDGSNDKIVVPDADALSFTNAMSISLWINSDITGTTKYLIAKAINMASSTGAEMEYRMFWYGTYNIIVTYLSPSGTVTNEKEVYANFALSANTWYHIVWTYDGSNIKIYIDNDEKVSSAWSSNIYNGTSDLRIGHKKQSGSEVDFFNGNIDGFYMWNKALTTAEIEWLYNSGAGRAYSEF
jgi:hypothetical protein